MFGSFKKLKTVTNIPPWEHQFCILQNTGSNGGRSSMYEWASGPVNTLWGFQSHPSSSTPTNTILATRGCCSLSSNSAQAQLFYCLLFFFFFPHLEFTVAQLKYLSKNFAQGTRITKEKRGWKVASEYIIQLLKVMLTDLDFFCKTVPNHWKVLNMKEPN